VIFQRNFRVNFEVPDPRMGAEFAKSEELRRTTKRVGSNLAAIAGRAVAISLDETHKDGV